MNQNWVFLLLIGLLSYEVAKGHSLKRELTCLHEGKTLQEGTTYSTNQCQDICLCQDDGEVKCQPCSATKPTTDCNGWAHEYVQVPFTIKNGNEECHCFKFKCHKKNFKSIISGLWHKFKNKISSGDDDDDEGASSR